MYILDTDSLSLYLHYAPEYPVLVRRIRSQPPRTVFTTAVTMAELLQGRLATIRRSYNSANIIGAYSVLDGLVSAFTSIPRLPFDESAYSIFASFPAAVKRLGTNDCRIAAIAISRDMIVVSRNSQDFDRIPGVKHENWTE